MGSRLCKYDETLYFQLMSTRSTIIIAGNSTPIISGSPDTSPSVLKMSSSRSVDLPRKGREPSNTSASEHKLRASRPALRRRSSFGGTFHTPHPASHLHLAGLPSWKPTPYHIGQSSSEHNSDNDKVQSDRHGTPAPPDLHLPNRGWSPEELVSSFLDLTTSARFSAWTFSITILAGISTTASSFGALLGRNLTQLISSVVFILCCPPSARSRPKSASGFDYQFRRGQNALSLLSSTDSDDQEADEVASMLLDSSSDIKKTPAPTTNPLHRSSRIASLAASSPVTSSTNSPTPKRALGRAKGRNLQFQRDVSPDSLARNNALSKTHLDTGALVKMELQAKLALGAIRNFPKLLEHFRYEVQDPEWPRILEDPTMEVSISGEVVPRVVEHRLYWSGDLGKLNEALDTALPCLLTHLSISNCELAIEDVISIFSDCPALESLDIRQISGVPPLLSDGSQTQNRFNLPSLTNLSLTSRVSLDLIFRRYKFPSIEVLSLRLFDDGNKTNFDHLFGAFGRSIRNMRLRGSFDPWIPHIQKRVAGYLNLELDIGHICELATPRKRSSY